MGNTSSTTTTYQFATTHQITVHYDEPVSGLTREKHVWDVSVTTTNPDGVGWKEIEAAMHGKLPKVYVIWAQSYVWTTKNRMEEPSVMGPDDRVAHGQQVTIRRKSGQF